MPSTDFHQLREGHYLNDSVFAEKQRTFRAHYLSHLSDFTAFEANLTNSYAAYWLQGIEGFEAHPTDEVMQDDIAIASEWLWEKRTTCWLAMSDLEYYVKRAFPDNKGKLREFGFPRTTIERDRYVVKLVLSVFTMLRVANHYNTDLTAAGMPAGVITNLLNVANKLVNAEIEQEFAKRMRIAAAETRTGLYNAFFKLYTRLRDAAKVIYYKKPKTKQLWEMI